MRCLYLIGDCAIEEKKKEKPTPNECLTCMLVVINMAVDSSVDGGFENPVATGYNLSVIKNMVMGIAHWSCDQGIEVTIEADPDPVVHAPRVGGVV